MLSIPIIQSIEFIGLTVGSAERIAMSPRELPSWDTSTQMVFKSSLIETP
jgi:hypothetical protein